MLKPIQTHSVDGKSKWVSKNAQKNGESYSNVSIVLRRCRMFCLRNGDGTYCLFLVSASGANAFRVVLSSHTLPLLLTPAIYPCLCRSLCARLVYGVRFSLSERTDLNGLIHLAELLVRNALYRPVSLARQHRELRWPFFTGGHVNSALTSSNS